MIDNLITNQELELLLEIVESERRRLLPEIRHTDTRLMRTDLQLRLRTIERLIERFAGKRLEIQQAGTP
jgi:hypothetical protein